MESTSKLDSAPRTGQDPMGNGPATSANPFTGGWVYFIGDPESGPVKIGHSLDPETRARKMFLSSPVYIELLALFPGCRRAEREMHEHFAGHRLHGEWFERTDEIKAMIAENWINQRLVPQN